MSLHAASLVSKIGLLVGLGFGLTLVVADFTSWLTSGHPAMATPFHILPVALIMILIIGGIAGQCTVRLLRGQERLAKLILATDAGLEAEDDAGEGLGPETLAIARQISARLHAHAEPHASLVRQE